jgi:predicted Zn-dependent protease
MKMKRKDGRFSRIGNFVTLGSLMAFVAVGCATSPTGRKQLMLIPSDVVNSQGAAAFTQMKSQIPTETSPAWNEYINCVTQPLLQVTQTQLDIKNWEVVVFREASANAFALPGGKIGVHTGLLKVAKTDGQVAAVIGHEIGHVIAQHGRERVSQAVAAQGLVIGAGVALQDNPNANLIVGALGVGAQFGVLMPFGRTQESESDRIGLDLMARAGFDPRESVELWKNMATAGGGGPPQFLSTHPSHETRQRDLNARMAESMALYQDAQTKGRKPVCKRPLGA